MELNLVGEPAGYQWYQGELGDKSNPIPFSNHNKLEIGPMDSSRDFWVEASSPSQTKEIGPFKVQVNQAPAISVLSDVTMDVGQPFNPVAISLDDDLTSPADLTFIVDSTNEGFLDADQLQVTNDGTSRILDVATLFEEPGSTEIVLTAIDSMRLATEKRFLLTVLPRESKGSVIWISGFESEAGHEYQDMLKADISPCQMRSARKQSKRRESCFSA